MKISDKLRGLDPTRCAEISREYHAAKVLLDTVPEAMEAFPWVRTTPVDIKVSRDHIGEHGEQALVELVQEQIDAWGPGFCQLEDYDGLEVRRLIGEHYHVGLVGWREKQR